MKEPKPEKGVLGPGTVTSSAVSVDKVDEVIDAYEMAINSLKEVSICVYIVCICV